MGKFSRFVRKMTGHGEKDVERKKTGHGEKDVERKKTVGVPLTAPIPSFIASHQSATVRPSTSVPPPVYAIAMGPAPTIALPTLDPIRTVSPMRIPSTVGSTSQIRSYTTEDTSSTEEADSEYPAVDPSSDFRRQETYDTLNTLHRHRKPPRITSASFARLPEYVGSSDSIDEIEVSYPSDGTSVYDDNDDSDTCGMLSPIEPPIDHPTTEADVFSSSSSSSRPHDQTTFTLANPPTPHTLPRSRDPNHSPPPRLPHRPPTAQMPAQNIQQHSAPSNPPQKPHSRPIPHRRRFTPYPLTIHPPHSFPPTPSSESPSRTPSTPRSDPLHSSPPTLPRSGETGFTLQEFLTEHPFFADDSEEDAGSEESWSGVGRGLSLVECGEDRGEGGCGAQDGIGEEYVRLGMDLCDRGGARNSMGFR